MGKKTQPLISNKGTWESNYWVSRVGILSSQLIPCICPQGVPSIKVAIEFFITFNNEFCSMRLSFKKIFVK